MSQKPRELTLNEYKPVPVLRRPEHVPERAKFPVIDAHNHLFGELPADEILRVMDEVGVRTFVNVTANTALPFSGGQYCAVRRDIGHYVDNYVKPHPGRFAGFTMSSFADWGDLVLFKTRDFVERTIADMEADVGRGAVGLKVTKELGLRFKTPDGLMIPVDDPRLFPVWNRAGELGIPLLIHVSDPAAFFQPLDEHNEHYQTLSICPGWSFHGSFYSKEELLEQRNRMIAANPGTTFILPHVANYPEVLDNVAKVLDTFPNVVIDFSARIDELGRQPFSARDFMIRYRDRILFGVDMPVSADVYRCYFRFLETRDEYFEYPDYLGGWSYCRWRIYGLHLPDDVLRKIYWENAVRVIPGLAV